MVPWQRVARPDGGEVRAHGVGGTAGHDPFNPVRLGGTLRLGQPRSGQLPIRGSVKMRPRQSGAP